MIGATTIEIGDLVLRVPGIDPADARAIGEEVVRCLADALSSWERPRVLPGALELRIVLPPGRSPHELAPLIARQIAEGLR